MIAARRTDFPHGMSDALRDEDQLTWILRAERCAVVVGVELFDGEATPRQQVLGLVAEDRPDPESVDELALVAVDRRHVESEFRVHDLRKRIAPYHADVAHHDPPIGEREGRFVRQIAGTFRSPTFQKTG